MANQGKSVLVIGGGVIEYDSSGNIVSKSSIIKYLHNLSQYFTETIWITTLQEGPRYTSTILDTERVNPIILGFLD